MTREYYNGKEKKRPVKKKKTKAIVLTSLLLITIAVLCVLSLTVFFRIDNIQVVGNTSYTDSEIIEVSDIVKGDNLIRVPTGKVKEALTTKLPFVSEVKIDRKFPSTVKITVKETEEVLMIDNGKTKVSADLNGKVLKKYSKAKEGLIGVTLSAECELKPGRNIVFKNDRESELFNNYLDLINSDLYDINFINISDAFNSYIKIDDRIIVSFGSATYFEEKLAFLNSGYKKISENASGIFDLSGWTPDNNTPRFKPQSVDEYKK